MGPAHQLPCTAVRGEVVWRVAQTEERRSGWVGGGNGRSVEGRSAFAGAVVWFVCCVSPGLASQRTRGVTEQIEYTQWLSLSHRYN